MAYLAVNRDGSTTGLGSITGYQVEYKRGGRKMLSKPFKLLWQAFGFQKSLQMGQDSLIVPVYSKK